MGAHIDSKKSCKKMSKFLIFFDRRKSTNYFELPLKIQFLKIFKIIVEIFVNSSLNRKFYTAKRLIKFFYETEI